jgi:hypothetical protein
MNKAQIEELKKPLPVESIDFRIQSINKGGYANILAYKDARADMNRLDDAVGPLNWKREHTRENHNCIISIWDDIKKQWISKEDTGTESFTEKEKGLASDSFKRAGFNWGIGRELYDYPLIQIKLNGDEFEIKGEKAHATWNLKLREWKWESEFKDGNLTSLKGLDQNGRVRFDYNKSEIGKTRLTDQQFRTTLTKFQNGEVDYDTIISKCVLTPSQDKELKGIM